MGDAALRMGMTPGEHPASMRRDEVLDRIRAVLPTVRDRFAVRDLSLFGSVARDEATEASDVDVLVDFDGPTTFDAFMGLKLLLEDTLGLRVDLVTRAALKPRLRARIEAEAARVA